MTEDACRDSGGHRPAPDLESWNPGALRRKQRSSISAVNVRSRNLALRLATKEETKGQINSGQSLQPSQPLTKSTKLPTEQLIATSQSSKQHRRAHVEQRQKNSSAPARQISVVHTSPSQESVVFFPREPAAVYSAILVLFVGAPNSCSCWWVSFRWLHKICLSLTLQMQRWCKRFTA